MKILIIAILTVMSLSVFAQTAPIKIMECEAQGFQGKELLFEIKSDVFNSRVNSQGTTITSTLGGIVKVISLTLTSKDKFEDHFEISILVKHGKELIESETLKDLSLDRGTNVFGISKSLQGYEMLLTCTKL